MTSDLDDLCTCGHVRDEHDAQGYCMALDPFTTCECVQFDAAEESP